MSKEDARTISSDIALLLLSRWESIAKNSGEKWLREHPLVEETTKLLNEESIASSMPSPAVDGAWTPDQFWQYVEGLTDALTRDQIRDMLPERGLLLVSSTS